jgi:hypothetical protein
MQLCDRTSAPGWNRKCFLVTTSTRAQTVSCADHAGALLPAQNGHNVILVTDMHVMPSRTMSRAMMLYLHFSFRPYGVVNDQIF